MRLLLTFASLALCFSVSNAAWIDNFTSGSAQQSWLFGQLPSGSANNISFESGDGGYMRIESTTAVGSGGSAAVFGFVNETFAADPGVRVRSVLNPTNEDLVRNIGVLAHLDPANLNAYSLTINYGGTGGGGGLQLSRITSGVENSIATLSSISNYNRNASYTLELEVIGTAIRGRVLDYSDSILGQVSATDLDPLTGGVAGVVAQRELSDGVLRATFGSVAVTAVPEPTSFAFLFAAGSVLPLARRYRKRKAAIAS